MLAPFPFPGQGEQQKLGAHSRYPMGNYSGSRSSDSSCYPDRPMCDFSLEFMLPRVQA